MAEQEKEAPDYIIIFVIITLLTIGLIMILSASSIRAYNMYEDSYHLFKNQLLWAVIGLVSMFIFMKINYKIFQKYAKLILLISILGLILVLIPGLGKMVGGSRRWIGFGSIGIQPSEIAKIAIVFYLAQFLSNKRERLSSFVRGLLPLIIVLGIIFFLILLEPDLGTGVTITGTFLIMLFAAGIKLTHIIALIGTGIPLLVYFIFSEEYRKERFLAFLNPWEDPLDTGYHIIQSLIALGTGGVFGVGLGNSRQKFLYLPEPGTDFIFAVLGEELGLIGAILIILLYFILIWRGLRISLYVPDMFGSLLAIGITSMIGL
ncbi:MAG: putative lipid II flippase FtsW, partial [Halanaerobiaceae bacterium]